MNQFNQFDISDFFDSIQDPLFLIDSEEFIFFNTHFTQNFEVIKEPWKTFFSDEKINSSLDNFFETGELSKIEFTNFIRDKSGEIRKYQWEFINLPSSYNSRFLVVKGFRIETYSQDCRKTNGDQELSESFDLGYMQSILSNSHDLIAILDEAGRYQSISYRKVRFQG